MFINHHISRTSRHLAYKMAGGSSCHRLMSLSINPASTDDIMKYLTTPPYIVPNHKKIVAAPMVYISGEEMTNYTMKLM